MPRIIGGTERSRMLTAPEGMGTRPTLDRVRENLFNILQHRIRDAVVLDLFAGSGAIGLEAVSRGATFVVLVDNDPKAAAAIRQNIKALRYETACRFLQMDWQMACRTLQAEGTAFSLVYLDPPYAMNDLTQAMETLQPLVTADGMVVVEHDAKRMPVLGNGWRAVQQKKYGAAGLLFLTKA